MTLPYSRLANLVILGSVVLCLLLVAAVVGVLAPGHGEDVPGPGLGSIIVGTGVAFLAMVIVGRGRLWPGLIFGPGAALALLGSAQLARFVGDAPVPAPSTYALMLVAGVLLAGLGALVIPPRRPKWKLLDVVELFSGW